jgi:nicotinic acid mononucleotide adenylyltransferase
MKKYRQLIKELPTKKVVFAFGRFNPPTTGHELLVKTVKKLASTGSADHAIYASKTQDAKKNPLSVDKKVQYLGKMFPSTKFVAANQNVRTYIEAVKELNKKYKNLVMVAGSDRVQAYQELLNKYNGKEFHFDTIEVVSAGERDPDADDASGMSGTKMRNLASKGDYASFKKGLPSTLRDIDGKRLMNDVRLGMGIEALKEQVRFDVDALREEFFKGKIYTVGQFVESDNQRYEIIDRGSNYLVLVNSTGETCKKWIQDVTLSTDQLQEDVTGEPAPEQITFKGYTTKNFGRTADAAKAFQDTIARASEKDPVAVLNALKSTDTYMGINDRHIAGEELTDAEITQWKEARVKAQESLARVGEFMHHMDYFHTHEHELEGLLTNFKDSGKGEFMEELSDKTLRPTDKIKVARIIATMLGVDKVEATSNPELLVNTALRRIKTKTLNPEALNIVNKMLAMANEMGIDYDTNLIPQKLQVKEDAVVKFDPKKTNNIAQGIMTFDDYQKLKNMTGKAGHSFGHADNDHLRKMKVKHVTEASALERFRAAAAEREKKHDEIERKRKEDAAKGKENMSGAIDRLEKQLGESAPFNKLDQAVAYATDKVKTHRDHLDGIEVYKHKSGGYDVNHTMNANGRNSLNKSGAKHLGTVYKDKPTNIKEEADTIQEDELDTSDYKLSASGRKVRAHRIKVGDNRKDDDDVEDMKEAKMSDADMAERERIVKGMKKNIAGFKARYGKDAESVMYATATKQAMKEEAVDMSHIEDHKDQQEQNIEDQLMAELDLTDEQIDHIVDSAQEDDFIEEYDDEELSIVDEDSGEEIPEEECGCMNEEKLMEVLSKVERIRARLRFAKTKGKRERKAQIALRTRSTNAVANKRARRLAIKLMKNRLLRGRDANKISIGEKERIERIIQKRKVIVGRIAVKLVPRIRQIEKSRLSHTKFTKGNPNVAF